MTVNFFNNHVSIFQYVMIPKSQDAHAGFIEAISPLAIGLLRFGISVLPSVQFNCQATCGTVKVDDVATDEMLPTELVTLNTFEPKIAPKFRLRVGR